MVPGFSWDPFVFLHHGRRSIFSNFGSIILNARFCCCGRSSCNATGRAIRSAILQSDRVGGFFQEQRFELHLFKSRVEVVKFLVAFTDAAEIEFKVSVFLPAAFFKQHVSQTIALFSISEEVAYALQTRMEGKIIGTPRIGVMVTQSCLIDHGGEHRNGRIRHQAVQICKEAIAQIAVRAEKSEIVLLSTYLALMQNGGIVTPIPKLKTPEMRVRSCGNSPPC